MGAVRLELRLSSHSEWLKIFDPRDWTILIPTVDPIASGTSVRIDLDVEGWLVTLRGTVVGQREEPRAALIALGGAERDRIDYLNGFVRGGLLNLRDKRRLPIKLPVTYGAIEGPTATFTKDLNEEGLFLFADSPLPETSQVHMLLSLPGRAEPLSLVGKVSHTILPHEDEPPGMGIVFDLDDATREQLVAAVRDLEEQLRAGKLPSGAIE